VIRLFGVAAAPDVERALEHRTDAVRRHGARGGRAARGGDALLGPRPSWAKEKAIGARMINARFRNADREAVVPQRVPPPPLLILADGLLRVASARYGQAALPHRLRGRPAVRHGRAVGAWRDPASGEPLESCCIVTTAPRAVGRARARPHAVIVPPTPTPSGWTRATKRRRTSRACSSECGAGTARPPREQGASTTPATKARTSCCRWQRPG